MNDQVRKIKKLMNEGVSAIILFILLLSSCELKKEDRFSSLKSKGRHAAFGLVGNVDYGLDLVQNAGEFRRFRDSNGQLTMVQFDTTKVVAINDADLEQEAIEIISAYKDEFSIDPEQLQLESNNKIETKNYVHLFFHRLKAGLIVNGAYIQINYAKNPEGKLLLRDIINRSFGDFDLLNPDEKAVNALQLKESLQKPDINIQSTTEIIFPKFDTNTGEMQFYRSTLFEYLDPENDTKYSIILANGSKEFLEVIEHKYNLQDHYVAAEVIPKNYVQNQREEHPLAFAIFRDANNNQIKSNAEGKVVLEDGTDSLSLFLSGDRIRIIDINENIYSFNFSLEPEKTVLQPNNTALDAINAFVSFQRINRFIRKHLTEQEAELLGISLPVVVNYPGGACNAFYDPQQGYIALYPAGVDNGLACGNMSRINDVAHHEYGHALDDSLGAFQNGYRITDGAFSEGIGDILATYYSDNSNLGVGFFQQSPNTPLRQLNINYTYPNDVQGEVHSDGLIIASTFWHLREELIGRYGKEEGANRAEALFFCHLKTTNFYVDSYQNVLLCDDDDGNPATQSPNYCLINENFVRHGLAKAINNCQEQAGENEQLFNKEMQVAIESDQQGATYMLLSTPQNISRVYCCVYNEANQCKEQQSDVRFEIDGSKQNRTIFKSAQALSFNEMTKFQCYGKDFDGVISQGRMVKISSK